MRFDGYYFLADAVGVQNLQPRAFDMARWRLREALFNVGEPPPEAIQPPLRRFMVAYAVAAWMYRVVLFLGIALIVYVAFFKAIGVLLLISTVTVLIGVPIFNELKAWWKMRKKIVSKRRSLISASILVAAVVLACWPFPSFVRAPTVLGSAEQFEFFPGGPGQIEKILVKPGQFVRAGEVMFRFSSPELTAEQNMAQERASVLQTRIERGVADKTDRALIRVLSQELQVEKEKLAGFQRTRALLHVTAPFDGHVVDLEPRLSVGMWVSRETRLGLLVRPNSLSLHGFLSEDDANGLEIGTRGVFIPEDPLLPSYDVEISQQAEFSAKTLGLPYLSERQGGSIAVEADENSERPIGAWFAFEANVQGGKSIEHAIRGTAVFRGRQESLVARAVRQIAKVIVREIDV